MKRNLLYISIVFPALLFFVIFIGPTLNAHAQGNIPPGSYKETCKDIERLAGNILWANCQKADGSYHRSKLILAECDGDISNNNGVLTCKQRPGKQPPNGSYKNSCKNIRVEGKQLKAQCEKKNGSWNRTSLNYKKCKGDISNDDGRLSCDGGGGKKIPNGSYKETCRDSYVEGGRLYSKCKNKNGNWKKTSINYKNCNQDIWNDNGKLSCGKKHSEYPKGSYKKSCKNLYMEGNVLEADCKNQNGKYKHSSIKYKKCNKGIYNDNGKLRCN